MKNSILTLTMSITVPRAKTNELATNGKTSEATQEPASSAR